MAADFLDDTFLGGGREAADRWYRLILFLGELPNEAGCVKIVRSEIVPPLGQTVGFIEYPATDLALPQNISDSDAAKLLGGNVQDSGVSQSDPLEYLPALR